MARIWPALLLLAGCAEAPHIAPGGIVSANPCIDAVLAQIAAPGQINAVSAFSHDPESASAPLSWSRRHPAVGITAEEIIAARPRLLLTGNLDPPSTVAAIRKAGITTLTFGVPATLAESEAQIGQIARAINRVEAGQRLARHIAAAAVPVQSASRQTAIIWQAGGFVAGRGTIQDEMLARAGFINGSTRYGLRQWEQLPLETLLRAPPDIIFMADSAAGDQGRALAIRRRLLSRSHSRTRIVSFPDRLLFCAGPAIIETMARFHAAREGA